MTSHRRPAYPRIRVLIPAVLLLFAGGASLAALRYDTREGERVAEERERADLVERMNHLQGTLEYVLNAKDDEMVRRVVSELGSDPRVRAAHLLGPDDVVVASTRLALCGRPAVAALADLDATLDEPFSAIAAEARRSMTQEVLVSRARDELVSVTPVALPAGAHELRPSARALLVMRRDLAGPKAHARRRAESAVVLFGGAMVIVAAVLALVLHLLVTRRVGRLVSATARIAEGDFAARTGLAGEDEVGTIGRAIDAMARRLEGDEAESAAAEQLLRASEERYRTVFEQASEAMLVIDRHWKFLDVNPSSCALLGRSREELLAMGPADIIAPEDLARMPLRKAELEAGATLTLERLLWRKDGARVPVELAVRTLPDGRSIALMRDIRPRREAEQMRAKLQAAERLASIGALAAGVGHEINNPLAYVIANVEHAIEALAGANPGRDRPAPDAAARAREALAGALEGAERVRRIVRDLRAFARADDDGTGPVDVRAVLDLAASMTGHALRDRARLVKRYDEVPPVLGNDGRLGQVFLNLLVNAAQAIPAGAPEQHEIRLGTSTDALGRVVIEVSDTGPGIPPDLAERVFEPFFTTKPPGEGSGLGLAISREIVAAHRGEITARGADGGGTTFRVVLPAAPARPPDAAAARRAAAAPRPEPQVLDVLVIDDDALVGKAIGRTLRPHRVTVVTSGREGLDACAARAFDAILCDLMMPRVAGWDVHRELAEKHPGLERRMVFMTGGAFTDQARAFLAAVPNRAVEKPIDMAALQAALDEAATGAATDAGAPADAAASATRGPGGAPSPEPPRDQDHAPAARPAP